MSPTVFHTSILLIFVLCYPLEIRTGSSNLVGKIVYALNAGGPRFVDSNGIEYNADYLQDGVASDYGKRFWAIERLENSDESILYQTERYGTKTFGYDVTVREDGDYVLVLKFCEVYFINTNKKVFNVELNGVVIVENLDIYRRVGGGVAHDEIIPFKISEKGRKLTVNQVTVKVIGSKLRLDFVKGFLDNPKINAFYILRGSVDEVPQLLPLRRDEVDPSDSWIGDEEEEEEDEPIVDNSYSENDASQSKSSDRIPKRPRYYEDDEDNWTSVLQVGGALAVCVVVFLLVRKVV